MKTFLRAIFSSLALGLVLLFTSCEKQEGPDPCQVVKKSACIINGTQQYNLEKISNASNQGLGNCDTYRLNQDGDSLFIQFFNSSPSTHNLYTIKKDIAFRLVYKGVVYICNAGSGTQGSFSGVYTDFDDWSESFNFEGIEPVSGNKINVCGSFVSYKTGSCDENPGTGYPFRI